MLSEKGWLGGGDSSDPNFLGVTSGNPQRLLSICRDAGLAVNLSYFSILYLVTKKTSSVRLGDDVSRIGEERSK